MRCRALPLALVALPAAAQQPIWSARFGTAGDDRAAALAGAPSGFYLGGGTTGDMAGPNAGGTDAWLARLERGGSRVWTRQLGSATEDTLAALAPDGVGGVYAAGSTAGSLAAPNAGLHDAWIARFTANGDLLWLYQLGTAEDEFAQCMASDGTSGFIVGGSVLVNSTTVRAWFSRYNAAGQRAWTAERPGSLGQALLPDEAGGAIAAGSLYPWGAWFAHYDGAGQETWSNTFGGWLFRPEVRSLAPAFPGFYAVGPYTSHPGPRGGWIGKFDNTGASLWSHSFVDSSLTSSSGESFGGVNVAGDFLAHFDTLGGQSWTATAPAAILVLAPGINSGFLAAGYTADPFPDVFVAEYGCYPDCDRSIGVQPFLNILDFLCFLHCFAAGDPYANCDFSTTPPVLNILDFNCFLNRFTAGCSAP
jgi:hypothetical protein